MKLEAQERVQKHVRLARRLELWWQVAAGPATSGERLVDSDRRGPTLRPRLAGIGNGIFFLDAHSHTHPMQPPCLDVYHLHESEALRVGISTTQYMHSVR